MKQEEISRTLRSEGKPPVEEGRILTLEGSFACVSEFSCFPSTTTTTIDEKSAQGCVEDRYFTHSQCMLPSGSKLSSIVPPVSFSCSRSSAWQSNVISPNATVPPLESPPDRGLNTGMRSNRLLRLISRMSVVQIHSGALQGCVEDGYFNPDSKSGLPKGSTPSSIVPPVLRHKSINSHTEGSKDPSKRS